MKGEEGTLDWRGKPQERGTEMTNRGAPWGTSQRSIMPGPRAGVARCSLPESSLVPHTGLAPKRGRRYSLSENLAEWLCP